MSRTGSGSQVHWRERNGIRCVGENFDAVNGSIIDDGFQPDGDVARSVGDGIELLNIGFELSTGSRPDIKVIQDFSIVDINVEHALPGRIEHKINFGEMQTHFERTLRAEVGNVIRQIAVSL